MKRRCWWSAAILAAPVSCPPGALLGGTFDYRVVAKRADPVGARLERVDLPTLPQPTQAPRVISVDEHPKPPTRPQADPSPASGHPR